MPTLQAQDFSCLGTEMDPVLKIENDYEENISYILNLELNCERNIIKFVTRVYKEGKLIVGREKSFPVEQTSNGILVEKLGFKVMKYRLGDFNSQEGGKIFIDYAHNLIKSKVSESGYKTITLEIQKNNKGKWFVLDPDHSLANYAFIKVDTNFIGLPLGLLGPEFYFYESEFDVALKSFR